MNKVTKIVGVSIASLAMLVGVYTAVVKTQEIKDKYNSKIKSLTTEYELLASTLKAPTFNYLKDVTVVIYGEQYMYNEETEKYSQYSSWLGTGTIYKIVFGVEDMKLVTYTYILTNRHVATKQPNIFISVEEPLTLRRIKAEVIANDYNADLSLIRIKGKLFGKQAFNGLAKNINIKDKVYVVGHNLGDKYLYGEGIFCGYTTSEGVIQVPVLWGNSGSGVFDRNGDLVGVIFAIRITYLSLYPIVDTSHGLIVTLDQVKDFLKRSGY